MQIREENSRNPKNTNRQIKTPRVRNNQENRRSSLKSNFNSYSVGLKANISNDGLDKICRT